MILKTLEPSLKHFELQIENQDLFVVTGMVEPRDLAKQLKSKINSLGNLEDIPVDLNELVEKISGIFDHQACYTYLGRYGRPMHLIHFKLIPYFGRVTHEVSHFAFSVMREMGMDPADAGSGEEFFCILCSHWSTILGYEVPIIDLPGTKGYSHSAKKAEPESSSGKNHKRRRKDGQEKSQ